MFVITGVTGKTGSVAADTLLAAGKPVRVVVRDAAKGAAWKAKGAEVAVASAEDRAAFAKALTGATGVYLLLPPPAWNATGIAAERTATIESITAAVVEAKPKHVVFLSSVGADQEKGTGPVATLHRVEQNLTKHNIPSTFLRASSFMENWASMIKGALDGGALYHGLKADLPIPQVATQDIGKTVARLLIEGAPSTSPKIVQLTGPKDLTLTETAAAIAKVGGKPVNAVSVPIDAMIGALVGMGASKELAELYGEMTGAINDGRMKFLSNDIVRGTTTLEEKLKELV
jgi:uncharacterized protein YbjT (DUF2867 family)